MDCPCETIHCFFAYSPKGSISASAAFHSGLRIAYIINGITTITIAPMISTKNHTVLLPVAICDGGMKLSTKAKSEPQKPKPARNHIRTLPRPKRKGRSA